jgi:hypothetical protein
MDRDRRESRVDQMKWIVKKTPVQLNPPSRTEIYNLRHGSTHQGETHDKAVGVARA